MLGRRLRLAALAAVALFVVASFVAVDEPWFAIWVALLGLAAVLPSLERTSVASTAALHASRVPLPVYFLALFAAVWVFAVNSYYIEIQRQRSERFDVVGVHLTPSPSGILRIGAEDASAVATSRAGSASAARAMARAEAAPALDVRLEPTSDPAQRWSATLRRDAGGFVVDSLEGVESLQQKRDWDRSRWRRLWTQVVRFDPAWVQLWGDELSLSSPEVAAVDARNGTDTRHVFRLVESGDGRFLEWSASDGSAIARAPLTLPDSSPSLEVLGRRLTRQLAVGLPLRELAWSRIPDSSAARDLVLTLVYEPQARLKPLERWGLLPPLLFRLASRDGEWVVAKQGATRVDRPRLTLGDTVRVVSHGRRWSFVLAEHSRGANRDPAIAVRFVRGPDPRLGWLPSDDVCGTQRRCTLISTSRLPPSVPHFYVGAFGLDTARYAFLGRVRMNGDRAAQIIASDTTYTAPVDSVVTVWARSAEPRRTAGYLLRIHKVATGEIVNLNLTFVGLAGLLVGVFLILRGNPNVRAAVTQSTPAATAAWTIANLALVFLGVRLVLGYRITYATPYYERGADSAVGAWVATILLAGLLLAWRAWAPIVVRGMLRLEDGLARWFAGATAESRATRPRGDRPVAPRTSESRYGIPLVIGGLVLLAWLRASAVAGALTVVGIALFAWLAVEYLRPQRREGEPASTPAEVLRADVFDDDWARKGALVIAACGLPLSVIARQLAVFVTVTLLAIYLIVLLTLRFSGIGKKLAERDRAAARDDLRRTATPRLAAPLVTLALLAGLNLVVLVRRLDGPTMLFAALFFLFLLIVRTGRDAGVSFTSRRGKAALAVLGIPLMATILSARADFGLGLVFSLPLVVTLLLAIGLARLPRRVGVTFTVVVLGIIALAEPVLRPHLGRLEHATTPQARSTAFAELGGPLRHWSLTADPVTRAVVRGLAASRPELLERVLVSAAPSPGREEILRSLEQAWGGRAYAASGLLGEGLAGPTVIGRGVPVPVSYAENTFSVYVLSEHGLLGGAAVLLLYVWVALTAALLLLRVRPRELSEGPAEARTDEITIAVVVGGALMLTIPAAYVAASNLGIVPLTGQNMPFLGLNAWSDATFVSAMVTAMIAMLVTGAAPHSASVHDDDEILARAAA